MEEFITKAKDMRPKKARALSLARWKSMKFSADGQSILISTDANLVLTLHAFEGDVKQVGLEVFGRDVAVSVCGVFTPGRCDVGGRCASFGGGGVMEVEASLGAPFLAMANMARCQLTSIVSFRFRCNIMAEKRERKRERETASTTNHTSKLLERGFCGVLGEVHNSTIKPRRPSR